MDTIGKNTTIGVSIATVLAIFWGAYEWHKDKVSDAVDSVRTEMQLQATVTQLQYERTRTDRKYERMDARVDFLENVTRDHIEEFDERIDEIEHMAKHITTTDEPDG